MKYICSICLLFCAARLIAQSNGQPGGPTDGEKKVNLSNQKKFVSAVPSGIAGIKVILAVPDSLLLGYIPADRGNETFRLAPVNKSGQWLSEFVSDRYGGSFVDDAARLIWVIRNVSLSTDSSGGSCFTNLRVDVYQDRPAGGWRRLVSTDTVLVGAVVDSSSYASALISAFDLLYAVSKDALSRKVKTLAAEREMTEDSVVLLATNSKRLRVVSDARVARGAFVTFGEFSSNTPSITGSVWAAPDTARGNGYVRLFVLNKDSSVQQLPAIWGVCFGGNELYKYEDGRLLAIEKSGDGFILSRFQEPVIRKNQAFYWRQLAVNSWPDETNPFSRDQTMLVRVGVAGAGGGAGQPVATRIDMTTGELIF